MASGTSVDTPAHFKSSSNRHHNHKSQLRFELSSINNSSNVGNKNVFHHKSNHQKRNSQRQNSESHTGHKRRHSNLQDYKSPFRNKRRRTGLIVPPTKFLLGGNINDPLNLESLADEEINKKMNEVTPYSSPVPPLRRNEQIEVLIPQNINDPLNLNSGEDIEFKLVSPKSKKRRKNKLKKKMNASNESNNISGAVENTSGDAEPTTDPASVLCQAEDSPPVKAKELERPKFLQQQLNQLKINQDRSLDKIVSPVVPQGSPLKFHRRFRSWSFSDDKSKSSGSKNSNKKSKQATANKEPTFRKKDQQFQWGNYNRYYGYRNGPKVIEDPRMKCFKTEWFEGKSVLDIGCNVGYLTLSIARDMKPKKIIGIDIDNYLVKVARKNVVHYINPNAKSAKKKSDFPISMAICHGPLATTVLPKKANEEDVQFPNNVFFVHGNYVLESEALLEIQKPEFHTILCLSLTKWIHLNFGDSGLKRAFKRMYAQLLPGGKLMLEAQPWTSYAKKKKMTENIYKHYQQIKLKPEHFNEYLLSSEVGFTTCELIDTPAHPSKGFCRSVYLFTKSEAPSSEETA